MARALARLAEGEQVMNFPLGAIEPEDIKIRRLESRIATLTAELATVRDAREQAEEARDARMHPETAKALELQNARLRGERDSALARVKEWEQAYDSAGFVGPQSPSEVQVFLQQRDRVNGQVAALKVSAAESALASARDLLDLRGGLIAALLRVLDRYEGCPAEDYADAWWTSRDLLRGHRRQLSMLSSAPTPAPCPGCAAARELADEMESAAMNTGSGDVCGINWADRFRAVLK